VCSLSSSLFVSLSFFGRRRMYIRRQHERRGRRRWSHGGGVEAENRKRC